MSSGKADRLTIHHEPSFERLEAAMFAFARHGVVVVLISVLLAGPLGAMTYTDQYPEREKPTGGEMMWDALVMRPVGIVATAVGSVVWLVSYPFAYLGGNTDESTEALVQAPFGWTFERPLGEF
jgi:hypothetical protein